MSKKFILTLTEETRLRSGAYYPYGLKDAIENPGKGLIRENFYVRSRISLETEIRCSRTRQC